MNHEKYFNSFRDFKVEQASLYGLNLYQIDHYRVFPQSSAPQNCKSASISFSIYLQDSWVGWLDDTKSSFKYLEFEDDDSNDPYLTYLRVNAISWLRFRVQNIILPTGRYNLYYKMKGPCPNIKSLYMVSVKHKDSRQDDLGIIALRDLQNLGSQWQWVPVYRDNQCTEMLEIEFNFELGDELSVELFSLNEYWTRD